MLRKEKREKRLSFSRSSSSRSTKKKKAKKRRKNQLTCRSSFESTTTTPSSHPACPTPHRSIRLDANSSVASAAEEEVAERSRRARVARATWNPARCPEPEEEAQLDFAKGFFARATSLRTPSISSAAPSERIPSGSQSQLGLPGGLLQAAGSEVGFGKFLPSGEKGDGDGDEDEDEEEEVDDDGNDEKVKASSSVALSVLSDGSPDEAEQRPRPAAQQRATAAKRTKGSEAPLRRWEERRKGDTDVDFGIIAAAERVTGKKKKK